MPKGNGWAHYSGASWPNDFTIVSAPASKLRRRFGLVCLGLALLMLIAGETVLAPHLRGLGLLLYWLGCLLLTILAAVTALLEVLLIGVKAREEQRALLETTLRAVEREKSKPRKPR